MIPSNVDSRRPDKVQRYKPTQPNGNAPGDDLTPDYMNILGSEPTTANADAPTDVAEDQQCPPPVQELDGAAAISATPVTVLPVSSQYGIATLPPTTMTTTTASSASTNDIPSETTTPATDTITETTAKTSESGDNKDLHSTPSRNDRFKVVKIASLEPFRRGRWKCMDYVDQTAAPTTGNAAKTSAPSAGTVPLTYLHTQSLPQHHFQQLLVQGSYGNQYFQNVPSQMIPQSQYFYQAPGVPNVQSQTLPQQIGVAPNNVQPVYISTTQPYIQQTVVPNSVGGFTVQTYPNVQYVPANVSQNQNSAFIPTSQNVNSQLPPNFQQSQTYAGQPSVSQPTQPVVNGHVYPPQNEPVPPNSLPTQVAKIAILTSQPQNQVAPNISIQNNQAPSQIQAVPVQAVVPTPQYNNQQLTNANFQQIPQQQINQQMPPQNMTSVPASVTTMNQIPTSNASTTNQLPPSVNQNSTSTASANPQQSVVQPIVPQMIPIIQTANIPTNVYTNPQFVTSVVSSEPRDGGGVENNQDGEGASDAEKVNSDDAIKPNPVVPQVNAIDNKIEQAMDLVKSHLMYTVREEVEVLKEKITELMEKIQQLETENNFLRSQLPKNPSGTPDPPQ
ncbi:TSC22 domain family protein 1-like isoform X1 [Onthophagus taurus]|uniref:TSC22 domain family protein 1-like isoform X1 n=1 Tax=Onthophagus taurus TaxID=166361 RepID=UPI0039BE65D0